MKKLHNWRRFRKINFNRREVYDAQNLPNTLFSYENWIQPIINMERIMLAGDDNYVHIIKKLNLINLINK